MKASLIQIILYLIFVMSQTVSASDDLPDMELLEFLGSYETDDNKWFDPTLLVDVEIFDDVFKKGQENESD